MKQLQLMNDVSGMSGERMQDPFMGESALDSGVTGQLEDRNEQLMGCNPAMKCVPTPDSGKSTLMRCLSVHLLYLPPTWP